MDGTRLAKPLSKLPANPNPFFSAGLGRVHMICSVHCDNANEPRANGDTMAAKFEIYEDAAGKYRFRLKAANGEEVASGQAYETKAAAVKGTEAVKRAAQDAELKDLTEGN